MFAEICRDAACWAATGSMLQGWGTLLGAVAVIFAAWKASNTFEAFRRQKQEERRIDAAQQVLTFAYRARRNLRAARATGELFDERRSALEACKRTEWWDLKEKAEQDRFLRGQIVLARLIKDKDEWDRIFELIPVARALFGESAEEYLDELRLALFTLQIDIGFYVVGSGSASFLEALKRELFPPDNDDQLQRKIDAAVKGLEDMLLPVIRAAP
jgi:hypothetical protein